MGKNPIVHVEWRSHDPARLQAFYGGVFDWNFGHAMPGYTLIETGGTGGGIFQITPEMPVPPGIVNYIAVDELGPQEEKVRALGGQIAASGQEVPGVGWFTIFIDPDGNTLGMWKRAFVPSAAAKPPAAPTRITKRPPTKRRSVRKAKKAGAKKPAKKTPKTRSRRR